MILPGVLVGALFAFITSFDELIVALFLSGANVRHAATRRMWEDLRYALDPTHCGGFNADHRYNRTAVAVGALAQIAQRVSGPLINDAAKLSPTRNSGSFQAFDGRRFCPLVAAGPATKFYQP